MNSLTELNGYNAVLTLPYTDQRLANVFFDRETANNRTQIVNEGSTFDIVLGIEITDISNAAISLPVFRVNVSNLAGTTVTWPTVPAGCTVTNPATGIYEVSGMTSELQWSQVRQARITIPGTTPNGYFGNWTYSCAINYFQEASGNMSKSWTVGVTVLDVVVLTNPLDFVYSLDSSQTMLYTPQIINVDATYPGATWTITAVPSDLGSIVSFASTYAGGGTFTYNPTTKQFTIVGTRAQVNAHLAAITYTSTSIAVDFTLAYTLTNNQDSASDSKVQFLKNPNLLYLTNPTTFYYNEDAVNQLITNGPLVTDTSYSGSENYTITITPNVLEALVTLASTGTGGSSTFNASTKVLTIVGTRTQINDHLANVRITMSSDYAGVFSLAYSVVTPQANNSTKIQSMLCGSNDTEVTNMNISRSYVGNNPNLVFATDTPSISDLDPGPDTYTIFLSSALGQWELPAQDSPYIRGTLTTNFSLSGTKAEINAAFPRIRFYPNVNVSTSGTFTYEQQKNGVVQVQQTVALTGTAGNYTGRAINFLASGTFTPNPADLLYGEFDLHLIGAGGGGSVGGGHGGDQSTHFHNMFSDTTYTITVGTGGAAGHRMYNASAPYYGYYDLAVATAGTDTVAFGFTAAGGNAGDTGGRSGSIPGELSGSGGSAGGYNGGSRTNGAASSVSGVGGAGAQGAAYYQWVSGSSSYQLVNLGMSGPGGGGGTNWNATGGFGPYSAGNGASTGYAAESAVNGESGSMGGGGGGGAVNLSAGGSGGNGRVNIDIYAKGTRGV